MDSGAPVIEQMTLDLSWEDHVPGDCEHEQAVADIGGGKSLCGAWGPFEAPSRRCLLMQSICVHTR